MDIPPKYRCRACNEFIDDISTHLINHDHKGPFKIGFYCIDSVTKQSGYASLKFGDFSFELLHQYAKKGYRISINENRKLKFESDQETVNLDDDVSITTHPDSEYDITIPADAFLKTPQEKALYAELLALFTVGKHLPLTART